MSVAPTIHEALSVRYVWPLDGESADRTRHYLTYGRQPDFQSCPFSNPNSGESRRLAKVLVEHGLKPDLLVAYHHKPEERGRCQCGFKLKSLGWAAWEVQVRTAVGFRLIDRLEGTVRRFDTQREAKADCKRRAKKAKEAVA